MGDAETLAGQAAVWLAPGDLTGWDHNPQQHDVEGIARSIQELGFGAPVVARRDGLEIIAGHGRVKAAIHLGLTEIPVRLMDVDEATAHRLAIADNQLVGEMDDDLLAEVVDIEGWGEADLELLGFGEEEIGGLGSDPQEGWGETQGRPANHCVIRVALDVGDVGEWDEAVQTLARPGENQGDTLLRVLSHALDQR